MSERDQAQSGSQALRELAAKVQTWEGKLETWEETLGDWPEVVGESLTRALREAEKRGVAHQQELAGQWAERLGGEVQRQKALTAQLTQEVGNLHIVLTWQKELSEPWWGGMSRERWQVVTVSVLLALLVSWGGVTIYDEVGPPAKARAEMAATLSNFQEWWNAATEQQRAAIQAQRVAQQEANKRSQAPGKEGGR